MPPQEESALDVMNAALGSAGDTDAHTETTATTGDADANTEDLGEAVGSEADTEAADETGAGDDEGEGGAGEDQSSGTGERNPDGTFKKKPKSDEPELDAEGKPVVKEDKSKDAANKKQPDPLNDPIPKDLKQETQARMRSLIDTTKTVTAERDQIRQDFDYIIKGVQATGATPEQYGETLSFLALFNSGDPVQQGKALELVEGMADRLATMLGKERTVSDPLASHPDLLAAVKAGQINVAYAREMARTRNSKAFTGQLTETAQTQQRQQQEFEHAQATARNELTALEQSLVATDPDYARKRAILVPVLQPIFRSLHPKEWKAKFEAAYKAVPAAPKPALKPRVPPSQPLRPGKNNGGGGGGSAATSMMDAVSKALEGMRK